MSLLPALLLALSCTGKDPGDGTSTPTETTPVCARPADAVREAGDANGDGAVDVADAVLLLRHTTPGGPAPACLDAVDLLPDDKVQPDDVFSLLIHLGEDLVDTDEVQADRCDDAVPLAPLADCVAGEARSVVVLGFMEPIALPVGEAQTVLTVQVEAPDCGACTLRLREAVLAANGAVWPLPEVRAEVEICG